LVQVPHCKVKESKACVDTPAAPAITCVAPLTGIVDYNNLRATKNLVQQSWSYGFFTAVLPVPTTPGTFTIIFTALKSGVTVAETLINIVTTTI
jgi:hypothetical protein